MTTFFDPDEATDVDFAETKRGQSRLACFLHLRDLCYLHPEAAPAGAIAQVIRLEAAVVAEKVAREKRLANVRERARRKAAVEQAKAESQLRK
jgi:hypothetical protein